MCAGLVPAIKVPPGTCAKRRQEFSDDIGLFIIGIDHGGLGPKHGIEESDGPTGRVEADVARVEEYGMAVDIESA